ncbi:MAG: CARDB domain-containing protein [Mariprofundaceae bacterium]
MIIRSQLGSKSPVLFLFLLLLPLSTQAQDIQWASDISMRPQAPKAGEEATFQLTVRAGKQGAKAFTVIGGIDGKRIFRKEVTQLKANRSRHLRFKWRATRGTHKVFFQIVSKARSRAPLPAQLSKAFSIRSAPVRAAAPTRATAPVRATAPARSAPARVERPDRKAMQRAEVPMQFSTKMKPISPVGFKQPVCEGTPLPDIEMLPDIRMRGSSVPDGADGLEVILPFSISVIVVNRGQCDTGRFSIKANMRIQAPGVDKVVQLGSKGAPSLKSCRTSNCGDSTHGVRFDFTPQYNHGYYNFTVEADASHSINEFNEENNVTDQEFKIDMY